MLHILLALALGALSAGPTPAAWTPRLEEFVHTSWNHHDGIPLGQVRQIQQTPDGYLWLATRDEGLLRFDGMRFVQISTPCQDPPSMMRAAADGGLWFVCDFRIFRREPSGDMRLVPQTYLPTHYRPMTEMFVDRGGRLWFWGRSLAYLNSDGSPGAEIPGTPRPEGGAPIMRFAEDSAGNVWFSDSRRLLRVRDGVAATVMLGRFTALAPARRGGIYALREPGHLVHVEGSAATPVAEFLPGVASAAGALAETDTGIWVGTRRHGLALVRDGRIELSSSSTNPGTDASVQHLIVDREGSIWAGTSLGLQRFRTPLAHLMSATDRLPTGTPGFVYTDSRNHLWIAADTVMRFENGRSAGAIPGRFHAIGEEPNGRIWLSNGKDIGYLDHDRFVAVRDESGSPILDVHAFRRSDTGELWALAPAHGLYRMADGRAARMISGVGFGDDFIVSQQHGVWAVRDNGDIVTIVNGQASVIDLPIRTPARVPEALFRDGDAVWVGTRWSLSRWRNGVWTHWTSAQGLPSGGRVMDIELDDRGRFWFMTPAGMLVVSRAQLDATPDGQPRPVSYFRIGSLDRITLHQGGQRPSPRITRDREGRMIFVTIDSVAVVDPAGVAAQSTAAPIVIESITADSRAIDVSTAARVVEPDRVEIQYTALSLSSPENIRFRYRLEPYERDWVEAGGQRRVTYGGLAPGEYRFRVIGSNSEGAWREDGAAVYGFRVASAFWNTWWFRAAVLLSAAGALFTGHKLRVRHAANRLQLRFDERLAERTRIAQDLHDTLLQGLLACSMQLHVATDAMRDEAPGKASLQRVLDRMRQVVDEGRSALQGLRADSPTDDLDRLFSDVAQEFSGPSAAGFRFIVEGDPRPLRPALRDDLRRIGREALVNAFRHAQARHIEVEVSYGSRKFRCLVRDDGRGIEPEILRDGRQGHWGLAGMRERAERIGAELHVHTSATAGTEVVLSIPNRLAFSGDTGPRRRWLFLSR